MLNKLLYLKSILLLFGISVILLATSCNSKEKTTEKVDLDQFISEMGNDLKKSQKHNHSHSESKVTVSEVLHTDRYSYLNVYDANDHKFWLAIQKTDINVGDLIAYKDGLLKQNFESKEYNRVFESIYLVSRFEVYKEGKVSKGSKGDLKPMEKNDPDQIISKGTLPIKGKSILSQLYQNPTAFEGKEIVVGGKVSKVNYNIMGINWVHLKNEQDPDIDLTITTNALVQIGNEVRFKGLITLNKDFGAGYKYDIIMENAVLEK